MYFMVAEDTILEILMPWPIKSKLIQFEIMPDFISTYSVFYTYYMLGIVGSRWMNKKSFLPYKR